MNSFRRSSRDPKFKSGTWDRSSLFLLLVCVRNGARWNLHSRVINSCVRAASRSHQYVSRSPDTVWVTVEQPLYTVSACLSLLPLPLPAGTLYARVQIQGVGVRELLCDILLHDISAAAVGQGLVPRSEQRRRNHEGEPCQEEQASSPLPSQTSKR